MIVGATLVVARARAWQMLRRGLGGGGTSQSPTSTPRSPLRMADVPRRVGATLVVARPEVVQAPNDGTQRVVARLGAWPPRRSGSRVAKRFRGTTYKRPFDLAALWVAGVLPAPLWLAIAIAVPLAVKLGGGGPVLYRQRRLGRGGRVFGLVKFRTMPVGSEDATGPVWAAHPDRRATPVGRVLRRLRLDELPQALNVVRGEMSLVGPRPERPELAPRCEREAPGFARRLAVRPGIAGLAQARPGAAATPRQKLRYDLLYVEAMGPWLDARLCAACLKRVLAEAVSSRRRPRREHAPGGAPAPPPHGPRYLRYRDGAAAAPGMNHQIANLACLLREADALGRLAVLPPLRLSADHNLGVARAWRWETYFDLAASALVAADGAERALPLACHPPPASAAPFVLGPGERLPAEAGHRTVVERRVYADVHARDVPRTGGPPTGARAPELRLVPSARVCALAGPVVAALGGEGCFAAVHVRRRDRRYGLLRWCTRPARIARRLAGLGVPAGTAVYVLSDERDDRYWRAFGRDVGRRFAVARHTDFAALAALVPPRAACPDNYLLYEAEKEVMRHAAVRVETFPGLAPEPCDAGLVPMYVWLAVRTVRRSRDTALRLVRRTVGERVWGAARAACRRVVPRRTEGGGA